MAPPKPPEEECECTSSSSSSSPSTPKKRKSNPPNTPTPGKRKVTGPGTPRAPKNGTPNSAPARKKNEPTLLGDFLLGRPSPGRPKNVIPALARRKSLDAVKAEMRAGVIARVQAPGKVQDRVKQWQKASAKAGPVAEIDEIVVEVERSSGEETVGEEDRLRVKYRGRKGARKSRTPEQEPPGRAEKSRSRSSAPPKRVVSDAHWMNKKAREEKGSPIPKNFLQKTALNPPLEKKIEDWVKRSEFGQQIPQKETPKKRKPRKVDTEDSDELPRSRKASRQDMDHGIRVTPSRESADDGIRIKPSKDRPDIRVTPSKGNSRDDGIRVTPSKGGSHDDGIRVTPSKLSSRNDRSSATPSKVSLNDDGIRVTPLKSSSRNDISSATPSKSSTQGDGIRIRPGPDKIFDDGIRIRPSRDVSPAEAIEPTPARRDTSQRRPKDREEESPTPRNRSEKHLKPPARESVRRDSSQTISRREVEEEDASYVSPTPTRTSRRSATPPGVSLDEIPYGNSAFSVLDLPLGAEAGTMRRPPPKRNNSFANVPKVLKRVYEEGMKIVHEAAAEPPRGGPNHPPSIESWIRSTGDPFVDKPSPPASVLDVPESSSRRESYNTNDRTERELTADHNDEDSQGRRRRRRVSFEDEETPISNPKSREALPSMENSPPISPSGLKRSPATRNTSSPKTGRKTPFKAAIFSAFQGESALKKSTPSPYDFIGLSERDMNRASSESRSLEPKPVTEEPRARVSPRVQERTVSEPVRYEEMPPPPTFARRLAPMTGAHRLSTIASVETFSTSSSASTLSQTASDLSETTVTQDTVLTGDTGSSLSRHSKKSTSKNAGLKRRLTKHSDLMSMLSLPDTTAPAAPGRAQSIRSARSVRSSRKNLETGTIGDLMRELAEDETNYMRELNTLVDGVIPVLLTSVVSKSDAAIAAGLIDPFASSEQDTSKPIVDMGIALEKLKSLHKRIPTSDSNAFLYWAQSAQKTYDDYLRAWRAGFQDVVVNLAPASPAANNRQQQTQDQSEMPVNPDGYLVSDSGERVDVSFLLQRPLVRIKKLLKLAKGLEERDPSEMAKKVLQLFEALEEYRKRRVNQERARREDLKAANTDTTRARDPTTLAPQQDIAIDRTYQVTARDLFSFNLEHSSGQKLACQVELVMRNHPSTKGSGDVLICEDFEESTFLLFPPQDRHSLSARIGANDKQLVVLMRGFVDNNEWREVFILDAEDAEAAQDWISMLGTNPIPPPVSHKNMELESGHASVLSTTMDTQSVVGALRVAVPDQAPIGERARGQADEEIASPTTKTTPVRYKQRQVYNGPIEYIYGSLRSEQIEKLTDRTDTGIFDTKVVEYMLHRNGKKPMPATKKWDAYPSDDPDLLADMLRFKVDLYKGIAQMSSGLSSLQEEASATLNKLQKAKASTPDQVAWGGKVITPETAVLKKSRPITPSRDDCPPPPPVHKLPVSPEPLKNVPVLDASTPKTKNRRTSSPLKHEYRPSDVSGESSAHSSDEYMSGDSYTGESSSDESDSEIEDIPADLPLTLKDFNPKRVSPNGSVYSMGGASLAPSNSASQGPFNRESGRITPPNSRKFVAMVSYWKTSGPYGWVDICNEPCSIVITPGNIEVFQLSQDRANSLESSGSSGVGKNGDAGAESPLVEQILVPWVSARLSNAIDVEIGSPPTVRSTLEVFRKKKNAIHQLRYRTLTTTEGAALYAAVDHARMNNPRILEDQERSRFNTTGGRDAYERAIAGGRRRSFLGISLGRKKSYRAPAREESEVISDPSSKVSSGAFSRLRRLSGAGRFNINKSTLDINGGMNSGNSSEYDGSLTPPRTPSQANSSSMYSTGLTVKNLGFHNIPFRLYEVMSGPKSQWFDHGHAHLTVLDPNGMKSLSTLDHGPEKRIVVTRYPFNLGESVDIKGNPLQLILDVVIGRDCFKRMGRVGVACTVYQEMTGDDGRVGFARARGGVGARQKLFCFQLGRVGDMEWVYSLVTSGQGR